MNWIIKNSRIAILVFIWESIHYAQGYAIKEIKKKINFIGNEIFLGRLYEKAMWMHELT